MCCHRQNIGNLFVEGDDTLATLADVRRARKALVHWSTSLKVPLHNSVMEELVYDPRHPEAALELTRFAFAVGLFAVIRGLGEDNRRGAVWNALKQHDDVVVPPKAGEGIPMKKVSVRHLTQIPSVAARGLED
jgi:hypothetical protein